MENLFYLIIALAVCVSVHEASHAGMAYLLGDPTAKREGRLTLNPLKHLDPLGTLMLFIVHFGWGKPVPYNEHNLRQPRRDAALIAMAGPLSNLITALFISLLLKYLPSPSLLLNALQAIFSLSLILFLFNLIPIAPLDGSKLVGLIIPRSLDHRYQAFLAQGPVILIVFIIADRLISEASGFSLFSTYLQYGYELITVGLLLIT